MISSKAIQEFLNRELDNFEWVKTLSPAQVKGALLETMPPFLIDNLWLHQQVGLLLMQHQSRFIFHYGMGAGKTNLMLTMLRHRKLKGEKPRAIIFVPYLTAVDTWINEVEKWAPELKCCPLLGNSEENLIALQDNDPDLFVICYQTAVAMVHRKVKILTKKGTEKTIWELDNYLVQAFNNFETLICDEIHKVSNHNSLTFELCKYISNRADYVYGLTGTPFGKSQPLDSKLLTPTGWKLMEDVKIGDLVISELGTPVKVIGIHPQQIMDIYEVTFDDGSKTRCSKDHLWAVFKRYQRENSAGSKKFNYKKDPYVIPLHELMKNYVKITSRRMRQYSIPIVKPVKFEADVVPLDPYVLGYLLGNGSFSSGGISVATIDIEVINELRRLLPDCKITLNKSYTQGQPCGWRISKKFNVDNHNFPNPVAEALKKLSLYGKSGAEKFVPECYLFNTIEARLSLLQGLMDSDGTVTPDGVASFTNTNMNLCLAVQFIFNSLGGTAKILGPYRHKEKRRDHHKLMYYVHGHLPSGLDIFRLKRKDKKVVKNRKQRHLYRAIDKIELVSKGKTQCISVASETGLYVTDDFIVTHNSLEDLWAEFYLIDFGKTLGPNISFYRNIFFTRKSGFFGGVEFKFQKKLTGKLQRIIKNRSIHYSVKEFADMPEKQYFQRRIKLPETIKSHVEKAKAKLIESQINKDYEVAGNAFMQLRQLSSGFMTFKDDDDRVKIKFDSNPKLDVLCELIESMPPECKMVVFHDYIFTNQLISDRLKELKIGHARIWGGQRDQLGQLKKFREDERCIVLLINSRSGSSALNLQNASYICFFECPSVIDREQAEARCYRPGQKQKVMIYDLFVGGTVDEENYNSVKEGGDFLAEFLRGKKRLCHV